MSFWECDTFSPSYVTETHYDSTIEKRARDQVLEDNPLMEYCMEHVYVLVAI